MKLTSDREWAEILITCETVTYAQAVRVVKAIRKETIADYKKKQEHKRVKWYARANIQSSC